MDNLTHSLVGAALAHLALPEGAARAPRRMFLAAGVVAANLPDIDLLYVGVTPPPLGYLLHHRGHTHTLVGLAAQGLALAAACRLVPPLWRMVAGCARRLWALVAVALLSHILLDAGNSYGVHPFYPLDGRWYFGDAVFILEPWLWVLLGVPVAWNVAGPIVRAGIVAILVLLPMALTGVGIVRPSAFAALALSGMALSWWSRRLGESARALVALLLSAGFIAVSFLLASGARHRAAALLAPRVRGQVVDVVLNPNPADPLCWMAIAVERDEAGGRYVLHRGTLSLAPGWRPATACASHRFTGGAPSGAREAAVWDAPLAQSLARLRRLSEQDCWTRAWMQFGRAPALREALIYDLRFENGGGNFTAMPVTPDAPERACPAHVTSWAMPRADLLRPGATSTGGEAE
jgi:inner membrane protein